MTESFFPNGGSRKILKAAIGAHQDDVEIMAFSAIHECYGTGSFAAVVLSDGAGSPLCGKFAHLDFDGIKKLRSQEQKEAAVRGDYGALYMLNKPSENVKAVSENIVNELSEIIAKLNASELYIHSPFDKHPTHIGAMKICLAAVNKLPQAKRPKRLIGCEVWRGLDWFDGDSDHFSVATNESLELSNKVLSSFESQNLSKNYLGAARGRRLANATFSESHAVNAAEECAFFVDLSVFLLDNPPNIREFVEAKIDSFKQKMLDNF